MQIGRDAGRDVEIRAISCIAIAGETLGRETPPRLVCCVLASGRQQNARWNNGLVGQSIIRYRDPVDALGITRRRSGPAMPRPGAEIRSKHLVGLSGDCCEPVRADGVRRSCLHQRNRAEGRCDSLVALGSIGSEISADMYFGRPDAPGHFRHNLFRSAPLDNKLSASRLESSVHIAQGTDEKRAPRKAGRPHESGIDHEESQDRSAGPCLNQCWMIPETEVATKPQNA